VIDVTLRALGHASHPLAAVSDAEVLTVAVVAAAFFGNHHARALAISRATGYQRGLSTSRFSRRVHALADWLALLLDVLVALFAHGPAAICDFINDSMPISVCKRVRARRCRTVQGRAYCVIQKVSKGL
jgi:hypothetical protein